MSAILMSILTFFGTTATRVLTDKVLGWIALKALLVFLCLVVVPILLNNFAYDIIEIFINFASGQSGGVAGLNGAMSFSGLAGWLLQVFKVPETLSVLSSALILRVTLNMVPFVRLAG